MKASNRRLKLVTKLGLLIGMGFSMNADAGFFGFGGTTWKEEVLLHDGSKIIVERSQRYGGRHEIGQTAPIKEQEISFTLPGTTKVVTWKSEYSDDVGRANFNLLATHILNGTPYIVASPSNCLAFNKWGRSNPPYVLLKYDGKAWKRIQLAEFPTEFRAINLVVNAYREDYIKEHVRKSGFVSAEDVKIINSSLTQPEYKEILREATGNSWCPQPTGPDGKSIPWDSFKAPIPIPSQNDVTKNR